MLADYEPRGNTPLFDAIGECVRRVEENGRAITVVVITDGMENASKEFTRESVSGLPFFWA
jgi:Mg-chelatase subunit ChlD